MRRVSLEGGFSTGVASLYLLDNCPSGGFPLSSVESWKSSVSQSTSSACCEVGGTVCLLFQIASGQSIGDFVFPEPGIYLCAVGNKFKSALYPSRFAVYQKGSITLKLERIQELKNLRTEDA